VTIHLRASELVGAIQYLRRILGEEFLNRFYHTNHPMFTFFFQWPEQWRMKRLARLARAIECLDSEAGNFGPLLRKIKDPRGSDPAEQAGDALSVLEAADRFLGQGFTISFEPAIGKKKPDFAIADPKSAEQVVVEVTRLGTSRYLKETDLVRSRLLYLCLGAPVGWLFCGAILAAMPRQREEEIYRQAEEACRESVVSGSARTVLESDFKLVVGRDNAVTRRLASQHNVQHGLVGPPIDLGADMARTPRKIYEKLVEKQQLPSSTPGILIIWEQNPLYSVYDPTSFVDVMGGLMSQHPHVLSVVLLQEALQGDDLVRAAANYMYIQKVIAEPLVERRFVVRNPAFRLQASQELIKRLDRVFI